MVILWLGLNIIFNAAASVLVKISAKSVSTVASLTSPSFMLGIVCFALGLLAYQRALSRIPLSIAYPIIISGTVILVTTVGSWVLRDPVPPLRIVGAVIIIIGVWVIMVQ